MQSIVGTKRGKYFFIFFWQKLCSTIKNGRVLVSMKRLIFLLSAIMLFSSCWDWKKLPSEPIPDPIKVLGYIPVYSQDLSLYAIKADTPRAMKYPGKIYVKDNLIFQNDQGFGIHVFDKSIPSSPQNLGFINLIGNLEISIKGSLLYANSYADLVVVDISNWKEPKEIQRIKGAFNHGYSAYHVNPFLSVPPPQRQVYYQCVDMSKGIHIGWKQDSIYNNTCFYN